MAAGVRILASPPQAPRANAICERLIGTLRRELFDRLLIVNKYHLRRVLTEYLLHYNTGRPHRSHGQLTPAQAVDLARALKVTPAAIYHHVDGRDAIVTLLRQKMARTVDASAFGQLPWDQALHRWAVSHRETFAAHPGTIGMLAAEPIADPAVHAQYEQAVTALEDAGFPRHTVLAVITAVENFVLGSALDLAAPPVMVTGIDADATPRLAEAAAATPSGRARADQAFHLGLDALITGLRHELSQADSDR